MVKVLLIGSGAREHAIAEALKRSRYEVAIFVVGGTENPAILKMAEDYLVGNVCDLSLIREFAKKNAPDFAVIGPEAPIEAGVVDMLLEIGVHSASPLATVGRLESSKSFTRDLLEKYGIVGNPLFRVFHAEEGMREFMEELEGNFVVKADGLKGGKGVLVSGDHFASIDEGYKFAVEFLEEAGRVVIEEKLIGQEFSLMSFCDGETTVEMPAVQDHKRAFDGDKGSNTGGMGSYSCENHSLPFLRDSDIYEASEITRKVARALFAETGCYFKGVMYGGFMATAKGVRLIEYNARFGDPEAMNVLPLLKTDFVELCQAIINGSLANLRVEFEKKATVCKYVVPNGYPDAALKGEKVFVGEVPEGVKLYFASVEEKEGELYLAGSRAIAALGVGANLEEAEKLAQKGVEAISGPVFYRRDIGTAGLVGERVAMMRGLRG